METTDLHNDTRGWIMSVVSGIACVAGASIICVDVVIRALPGKRNFRIQDSSVFLACSLSLSFGVMIFSALFSMLPSASRYLAKDEWNSQTAGFLMMGCFVGGFIGIQIVSRLLHQYMPSHVVDCDHTHHGVPDEEAAQNGHGNGHGHSHGRRGRVRQRSLRTTSSKSSMATDHHEPYMTQVENESTPLLPSGDNLPNGHGHVHTEVLNINAEPRMELVTHFDNSRNRATTATTDRRPSLKRMGSRVLSFFKDTKANCDQDGPCYGYSDPCGQECLKHLTPNTRSRHSTIRTSSIPTAIPEYYEEGNSLANPRHAAHHHSRDASADDCDGDDGHHSHHHDHDDDADSHDHHHDDPQHHHHVPTNAFMSIGLQTVIAIALHKFPEGFITYATNHVNSHLGFNVFMALFVHNIAEGFAMALPLYMALSSRWKAIAWSSLLGGLSQPAGAGLAALWFKIANSKKGKFEIDATAYACLFAVTAGIMSSVALQLFAESLSLNHNRNLSIFFAFLGMTILGVSSALVTE
ncbi:ZIP zinc transporter-domain-containing protein [Cladorrhinum sp. PSN259]|nr:ZIP zinc transporter-domain-containing protein [Cladorrhinum sp. PSN259]